MRTVRIGRVFGATVVYPNEGMELPGRRVLAPDGSQAQRILEDMMLGIEAALLADGVVRQERCTCLDVAGKDVHGRPHAPCNGTGWVDA